MLPFPLFFLALAGSSDCLLICGCVGFGFFFLCHCFVQFSKQADEKCQQAVFDMCSTLLAVMASGFAISHTACHKSL